MQDSFLVYKQYLYLKVSLAITFSSLFLYIFHTPETTPNGGTWLGYTLGAISTAIILQLMWFGIRKRQYKNEANTVRGWLSSHIYLGTSLIIITTLHTGFQFGWNLHTLAYVLMMLVIFSGFYGLYIYVRYPSLLSRNRAGINREAMLLEIKELDEGALYLASELGPKVHEVMLRSIKKSVLGTSVLQQLTGKHLGNDSISGVENALSNYKQKVEEGTLMLDAQSIEQLEGQPTSEATIAYVGNVLKEIDSEKLNQVRQLLEMVGRKKSLLKRVRRDIQLKAILQFWLYFHIPLSMALLAALITHIFSVFFYW